MWARHEHDIPPLPFRNRTYNRQTKPRPPLIPVCCKEPLEDPWLVCRTDSCATVRYIYPQTSLFCGHAHFDRLFATVPQRILDQIHNR